MQDIIPSVQNMPCGITSNISLSVIGLYSPNQCTLPTILVRIHLAILSSMNKREATIKLKHTDAVVAYLL
jgi:hypothetical protein